MAHTLLLNAMAMKLQRSHYEESWKAAVSGCFPSADLMRVGETHFVEPLPCSFPQRCRKQEKHRTEQETAVNMCSTYLQKRKRKQLYCTKKVLSQWEHCNQRCFLPPAANFQNDRLKWRPEVFQKIDTAGTLRPTDRPAAVGKRMERLGSGCAGWEWVKTLGIWILGVRSRPATLVFLYKLDY